MDKQEQKLPITFLHAEVAKFQVTGQQDGVIMAENDTFNQASGDSDTN